MGDSTDREKPADPKLLGLNRAQRFRVYGWLAAVIVGGLISATALTLLGIPALYPRFSKHKVRELQR